MTMVPYMRLRQICLVAPQLAPVISDIAEIMGLAVCYRDGNVAKYGLENALLPVDTILLEVVAPFRDGTTAGRFIEKSGGRGGYMAIFCCNDPDERGRNANAMGVRTANVIDHAPYHGVQLHPATAAPPSSSSTTPRAATIFWARTHQRGRTGKSSSARM